MCDEKKIEIKIIEDLIEAISKILSREEIERCMPKNLRVSCKIYQGICIVSSSPEFVNEGISQLKVEPLFMGKIVGVSLNNKVYPSPWLLEDLYECIGEIRSAVEAEQQGVKAFLYGNDLLVASVGKIYGRFRRGDIIAIIDPIDGKVIGVARAMLNPSEIAIARSRGEQSDLAAKNIFDLGWLLRKLKPAELLY
jgi:ribosome biogenesis protein Nip4